MVMSNVRSEIVRTPRGQYKVKIIGDDGPPIARVRAGASGLKSTAEERRKNKLAIQAALKAMYERQQAEAS